MYRKFATDFTWGQDFTHGLSSSCLACGLSALGARLPRINDQVSNMLLPAQPWRLPRNAGWTACPCKNRTGKSKRYYDANAAYFTFTGSFDCSQLLLVKSNFITSIRLLFFLLMQLSTALCYCLNFGDEKGEQRRNVTCPWWYSHCQTHEGGSEMPCS